MDLFEDVVYAQANRNELAALCRRYGITLVDGDASLWAVDNKIASPVNKKINVNRNTKFVESTKSFHVYLFENALIKNKFLIKIKSYSTYCQICDKLSLLGLFVIKDPIYFDETSSFCIYEGQLIKSFEVGIELINYFENGYTFSDDIFLDEINAYINGYNTPIFFALPKRNETTLYE